MWKEFKEFIAKGNVIDLAVGVVIGAAFGKIVTSLVEGVIMPPIWFSAREGRLCQLVLCTRLDQRNAGVISRR